MGRGSPEKPGVMLALDTGGSSNGKALLIEPSKIESETQILWMREMLSGAYLPHWGSLSLANGRKVQGLTFVVNRRHSRYRPDLTDEETLQRIKQGKGYLGSCRDYFDNTVAHLDEINVRDRYLHRLKQKLDPKT
jgi:cation transport protein ChaC